LLFAKFMSRVVSAWRFCLVQDGKRRFNKTLSPQLFTDYWMIFCHSTQSPSKSRKEWDISPPEIPRLPPCFPVKPTCACSSQAGTVTCDSQRCPRSTCSDQQKKRGQCCPTCHSCYQGSVERRHGSSWRLRTDPCTTCVCSVSNFSQMSCSGTVRIAFYRLQMMLLGFFCGFLSKADIAEIDVRFVEGCNWPVAVKQSVLSAKHVCPVLTCVVSSSLTIFSK